MSTPRSKSRLSAFRKLSGKRMYISAASRMISGEELKYRNGLAGLRGRDMVPVLPSTPQFSIWCICSDKASSGEVRHLDTGTRTLLLQLGRTHPQDHPRVHAECDESSIISIN